MVPVRAARNLPALVDRAAAGVFLPPPVFCRTPGAREEPLEREGAVAHHGAVVPAPVLVRLTGPLRVERDGRELAPAEVASRKGRTLLRLLCTRRDEPLRVPEIAAVLWPEDPPADPDAVVASLV